MQTATRPGGGFGQDATGPFPSRLGALIWFRSMNAPHRTYVEAARSDAAITYLELRQCCDRWARLLADLSVAPGATVGVAVADPLEFVRIFLGVMAAGRVAGPLDPGATDIELAAASARIRPALVVSDRPTPGGIGTEWLCLPTGAYGLAETGGGAAPGAVVAGPPLPGPATGASSVDDVIGPASSDGTGGFVLATSGTTGTPKCIELDEHRLLHAAGAVAAHHELSVADRGFCPLPLFHVNAAVVGLLATLVAGSALVVDNRFHRGGWWETLARHRVTWINAVPAILARLATLAPGEEVPPGIRFARSASAPLPIPVLERFERATGITVVETYGMTEAGSQITANPLRGVRKPGSVGVPVGTEVRVVPTDRVGPPVGTVGPPVGTVEIRGASVIAAYRSAGYEDRIDDDGWLSTGDLGYLDDDGYLYLVGRADDVINRGGEKIHPREIEDVIVAEPGVEQAVVVGMDHETLGQVPVAYLVIAGDALADVVRRVHERCAAHLSRSRRPVAFHVAAAIAQGATGKVRRRNVPGTPLLYSLLVQ